MLGSMWRFLNTASVPADMPNTSLACINGNIKQEEIVLPLLLAMVQLLLEYCVLGTQTRLQDDPVWHYNLRIYNLGIVIAATNQQFGKTTSENKCYDSCSPLFILSVSALQIAPTDKAKHFLKFDCICRPKTSHHTMTQTTKYFSFLTWMEQFSFS